MASSPSPPCCITPHIPQSSSSSRSKVSYNTTPSTTPATKQSKPPSTISPSPPTTQSAPSAPTKAPLPLKCLQYTLLSLPCSLSSLSRSPTPPSSSLDTPPTFCTRWSSSSEELCILQLPSPSPPKEASAEAKGKGLDENKDEHTQKKHQIKYLALHVHPSVLQRRVQELQESAIKGWEFALQVHDNTQKQNIVQRGENISPEKTIHHITEVRGERMEVQELIADKESDIELEEEERRKN